MAQQLQNITLTFGFGAYTNSPLMQSEPAIVTMYYDKQRRIVEERPRNAKHKRSCYRCKQQDERLSEFVQQSRTKVVLSGSNLKIFTGLTTLADTTPAGYTITANNWSACAEQSSLFVPA